MRQPPATGNLHKDKVDYTIVIRKRDSLEATIVCCDFLGNELEFPPDGPLKVHRI